MSEFEVMPPKRRKSFVFLGVPLKRIIIITTAVIALGIYTGILLFGPNSLTVLLNLEEQRTTYETYIKILKAKNAALQKEYFELKQLEPE
jgi:cell division protein FtsB